MRVVMDALRQVFTWEQGGYSALPYVDTLVLFKVRRTLVYFCWASIRSFIILLLSVRKRMVMHCWSVINKSCDKTTIWYSDIWGRTFQRDYDCVCERDVFQGKIINERETCTRVYMMGRGPNRIIIKWINKFPVGCTCPAIRHCRPVSSIYAHVRVLLEEERIFFFLMRWCGYTHDGT